MKKKLDREIYGGMLENRRSNRTFVVSLFCGGGGKIGEKVTAIRRLNEKNSTKISAGNWHRPYGKPTIAFRHNGQMTLGRCTVQGQHWIAPPPPCPQPAFCCSL
ncbi:hypothetical protein T02_6418 [Trichinella nativa]|uniref:Uncharacterized protein n=1 Tax=Trichinella nativa TaxID=6335 RepID=A0A0V1LSR4_9BILA|nr:hypothetical protein T02_6418 [Trichinella nativa]